MQLVTQQCKNWKGRTYVHVCEYVNTGTIQTHTYMHVCIHAYIHAYLPTYIHSKTQYKDTHTWRNTFVSARTYIHRDKDKQTNNIPKHTDTAGVMRRGCTGHKCRQRKNKKHQKGQCVWVATDVYNLLFRHTKVNIETITRTENIIGSTCALISWMCFVIVSSHENNLIASTPCKASVIAFTRRSCIKSSNALRQTQTQNTDAKRKFT